MTRRTVIGATIGVLALAGALTSAAFADEAQVNAPVASAPAAETDRALLASAPAASSDGGWHFAIPIGVYPFSMDGEIGFGKFTRDIDLGSSETGDKIDSAWGIAFDFGKGKWTGLSSLRYIKFEGDQFKHEDLQGNDIKIDPSIEWTAIQLGAAYGWIAKNPGPKEFNFSPTAEIRYTKMTATLDQTAPQNKEFEKDITWEDLVLGFMMKKNFTEHWFWYGDADYALAVSGNDEDSYDLGTGGGYKFGFDGWGLALSLGYRMENVSYEDEGDNFYHQDMDLDGPVLGATFTW